MSHFLSVRPKPQESGADAPQPPAGPNSQRAEIPSELQQVPVEQVALQPESRVVFHSDPRGHGADRFRFLRMRLREFANVKKLKTILVTSPLPGDGKSTVALNLATVLEERGSLSVLLLEADLYRPSLTQTLGLATHSGLAECLESGLDPLSALRRLEPLGCYLLPAGQALGNPTEILQSERFTAVMQALSSYFDWVVIDSPPVAPLTDALLLARHADASLVVVRADRTPKEAAKAACALLGPKHVLGIVLNGVEGLNRLYSKYYGYYGGAASGSVDRRKEATK